MESAVKTCPSVALAPTCNEEKCPAACVAAPMIVPSIAPPPISTLSASCVAIVPSPSVVLLTAASASPRRASPSLVIVTALVTPFEILTIPSRRDASVAKPPLLRAKTPLEILPAFLRSDAEFPSRVSESLALSAKSTLTICCLGVTGCPSTVISKYLSPPVRTESRITVELPRIALNIPLLTVTLLCDSSQRGMPPVGEA